MVRSFQAVVADIVEESRVQGRQRWLVLLDHTEFLVGETGVIEAVSRGGARLVVPVFGAVDRDGEVWHIVEKPLTAGTNVTVRVEHQQRFEAGCSS